MNKKEFEFYTIEEIKKILVGDEKLVFVDNGIEEVVVKYNDLPDFIVDINDYMEHRCNLKVYKYPLQTMIPMLTTIGHFLDKCEPEVRVDIIDRLNKLQNGEETKRYKIIDEFDLEKAKIELKKSATIKITNLRKTDFNDIRCNAIISINGKQKANVAVKFDVADFPDWKNSQNEYKELIIENLDRCMYLPKLSKCSKLLQQIYCNVCESESSMCHISFDDWKEHYANRYSDKDLDVLYNEIKKYKLEDVLELNDKKYLLKDAYSTEEDLKNYNPEYKIIGYGDLEISFNDDRRITRNRDYER